jgi:hypothetical protein
MLHLHACCKCMFQVFQVFRTYVVNISSGCSIYLQWLHTCFLVFHPDVAQVLHMCNGTHLPQPPTAAAGRRRGSPCKRLRPANASGARIHGGVCHSNPDGRRQSRSGASASGKGMARGGSGRGAGRSHMCERIPRTQACSRRGTVRR